jgi:putative transposase
MKYQFMQQHEAEFSLKRMSLVFKVSRSGYYKFIKADLSERTKENMRLATKIKTIHAESRQTYGSPRVHAELVSQGEVCSRKRVARIMRNAGVQAKMKKRYKITTQANPKVVPAPNLLQQNFTAEMPNQRWVTDITYVATAEGWLYVAAVLDLFSRRIVGLAMSERMTTDLVLSALNQAVIHREPTSGLVHHSDKGSQYTSKEFQKQLTIYCMIASMSGTGCCYDNAAMESFFHTLKTEHTYFEYYDTREQAKQSIFEYVEVFYNRKRLHSTLGYCSPTNFEKKWGQTKDVSFLSVH